VWPLLVVLAGDLFGVAHLGANYNFYDGLSSAGGSAVFALLLPSFAYHAHVDANGWGAKGRSVARVCVRVRARTAIFLQA
jgi:hypothetical protein